MEGLLQPFPEVDFGIVADIALDAGAKTVDPIMLGEDGAPIQLGNGATTINVGIVQQTAQRLMLDRSLRRGLCRSCFPSNPLISSI
jgi:hypothetical protein